MAFPPPSGSARVPPPLEDFAALGTDIKDEADHLAHDVEGQLKERSLFDGQIARGIGRKPRSVQPMGPKKKPFLCGSTAKRIRSSSPE